MKIEFTHYWVSGFGWENTIYQPEDFINIEKFGEEDNGTVVFIAINEHGGKHILKGKYIN